MDETDGLLSVIMKEIAKFFNEIQQVDVRPKTILCVSRVSYYSGESFRFSAQTRRSNLPFHNYLQPLIPPNLQLDILCKHAIDVP